MDLLLEVIAQLDKKSQTVIVPKESVDKLKSILIDAEDIAEEIEDSFGKDTESRQFWYWHDLRVALSNTLIALHTGKHLGGKL